jgi:hypothetical protein
MRFKDIPVGGIFLNKAGSRLRKVSVKRARHTEFDGGKFYVNPLERCELYKDDFTRLAEEITRTLLN